MNVKISIQVLLFIFLTRIVTGQIVYSDNEPFVDQITLKKISDAAHSIIDSLKLSRMNLHRADIFEIESELYLLPDGTFDVYQWQSEKWINLYENNLRGYNYGAKKFIFNNQIHSYGGYGFWNNHGQIIKFNQEIGEWELLTFTDELVGDMASWNDPVLSIFNKEFIIKVNLNKENVESSKGDIMTYGADIINYRAVELADNTIILTTKPFLSIRKSDNNILASALSPLKYTNDSFNEGIIHIKKNRIVCYNKEVKLIGEHDIDIELESFSTEGLKKVQEGSISKVGDSFIDKKILLFLTFLFGLFILGYFIIKNFLNSEKDNKIVNINGEMKIQSHPLLRKIYNSKGKTLNQNELDSILEIDHIQSLESKKFKRFQLIKEINGESHNYNISEFITRERDPVDGRKFVYIIAAISI